MFSQARKLKELRKQRRRGRVSAVEYAEAKASITPPKPAPPRHEPQQGFVLTETSVRNGQDFVRIVLRLGIFAAIGLILLLLVSAL